jgi:lysozyme
MSGTPLTISSSSGPLELACAAFIAPLEASGGPVLTSYQDVAGVWTIGYGTTTCVDNGYPSAILPGMVWTAEQCLEALAYDVEATLDKVISLNTRHPWSDNQIIALVSLAYNIGLNAFGSSSVLKFHNSGDFAGAAARFLVWDMAHVNGMLVSVPGLLARRKIEAAKYVE